MTSLRELLLRLANSVVVIHLGDPRFVRENLPVRFSEAAQLGYLPTVGQLLAFLNRSSDLEMIFDAEGNFLPGGEQHLTDMLGCKIIFFDVSCDPDGYREPEIRQDSRRIFRPTSSTWRS
jgi:hypothetical protein